MANEVKFPFDPNQLNEQTPEAAAPQEEAPEQPVEQKENQEAETPKPVETQAEETKPEVTEAPAPDPELDDNKLLKILQERGFKGKSLADLAREDKPAAPIEDAYDDETKEFLAYQRKTGRGLRDYQESKKDLTTLNPVDVAKDRIRRESEGADLSEQDLNFLLEKELGFDPSDEDLSDEEKAVFKRYYGSHLNNLKKEQQKYNEPVEGFQPKAEANQAESAGKVQLSNGQEVDAATYEKERADYLKLIDDSLQGIKEQKFTYSVDGKDGKEEFTVDYTLSDEDLHSVKSDVEDVGALLNPYQTESGFDMKQFEEDSFWRNKALREKAISNIAQKIRSQVVSEMTAKRKNLNFDAPNEPPKSKKAGYVEPGSGGSSSGPQVKYSLPT